jgi:antagonist of KipI
MSITIIKPGIMGSVQDLGRWGFQQYGVPVGGAMDKVAAALANIICGNDEQEPVIEMTLHGTSILFNEPTYCALTGGGCRAYIDDIELPFNRLLHVPAYSTIITRPADWGCRTYLSVAGGLVINKEMGSASTYVPAALGGIGGRNLMTGDTIQFRKSHVERRTATAIKGSSQMGVSQWQVPDLTKNRKDPASIFVLPGPEFELFDARAQENLFNAVFTISPQSNRMGYRLEGELLGLKKKIEMVSTAVTAGIIQVTHEVIPVILMADEQTTGGYPRIGRICSADIPLLAQMRPGSKIRFAKIEEQESAYRFTKLKESLSKIKNSLGIL